MDNYSIAVDVGGTFTDVVLRSDEGDLWVDKALTTHDDLLKGIFSVVRQVLKKANIQPLDINGPFVHATTTVTNALIERKGPTTALILTKGFRDILTIRSEHRYDIYDLQIEFPEPLIPDSLTFTVSERIHADQTIEKEIDEKECLAIIEQLKQKSVKSIAVCLINSYRNSHNEQALYKFLNDRLPAVDICISSDVAPQIREFPRTSTTAINAYTMPIARPYLTKFADRLKQEGFPNKVLIMLSSGGLIGADVAGKNPVRMIESGPAAGALAASYYSRLLCLDKLMSFDMGGTTAKACLIEGGVPLVTGSFEVDRRYRFKEGSGMPITVPAIDLIEIGAGGGSIASIDTLGLLKVGPQSAGSNPGPACYGRGGKHATVTDADLVLGLLDADNFLGGDMKLDAQAAIRVLTDFGAMINKDCIDTAEGVYRLVAESMAAATRTHATDRGVDYRGIPLFAFGGAGPVHACMVGALLQSESVIFAPQASVLSAFGTLVSPPRMDLVRSKISPLLSIDWSDIDRIFNELIVDALTALEGTGCPPSSVSFQFGADLRYRGQQNEVSVVLPEDPRKTRSISQIQTIFEKSYMDHYGVIPSHVPLEVVNWRLVAKGPGQVIQSKKRLDQKVMKTCKHRTVHLWKRDQLVPVFQRSELGLNETIEGPALIEERETTIVILPGWQAINDMHGCIVARLIPGLISDQLLA